MTHQKICVVCGKQFETTCAFALTCGVECRRKKNRHRSKIKMRAERKEYQNMKRRLQKPESIYQPPEIELNTAILEARKEGITYGEWQVRQFADQLRIHIPGKC